MTKELTQQEKLSLLKKNTNLFGKFGLKFTDFFRMGNRVKCVYEVYGNSHINTSNEISWMLGIWDGKSQPFVGSKKDEVCGYWRNNHDLLKISVKIGMLSPELAEKIKKGHKLTVEEAELIQANVKSDRKTVPSEVTENTIGISTDDEEFNEGELKQVTTNRYERNREAREKCVLLKGCRCVVCGFDFKETYGEIGEGFIHVHHVTPISYKGKDYTLDIANDLVPVCPNCHAMMHRKNPPLTATELKDILLTNKK